jgi:NAD(P)H-dependent FMN reductase
LVVYHPGLSDFPERIVGAFADGLAQTGWRIDRTTASKEAPADVAAYDLVVLASPIYGGLSKPMADYIARVDDFAGKPVVVILTGAGDTDATLVATRDLVAAANGRVVEGLAYTTMRPNESTTSYAGSNTDKAVAMAMDAGRAIVLPGT